MGLGNADKCIRLGLRQALLEVFDADARIDNYRHRARLEYGKGQGEEFQAGPDHEGSAHAPSDTNLFKAAGNTITFFI